MQESYQPFYKSIMQLQDSGLILRDLWLNLVLKWTLLSDNALKIIAFY